MDGREHLIKHPAFIGLSLGKFRVGDQAEYITLGDKGCFLGATHAVLDGVTIRYAMTMIAYSLAAVLISKGFSDVVSTKQSLTIIFNGAKIAKVVIRELLNLNLLTKFFGLFIAANQLVDCAIESISNAFDMPKPCLIYSV